MAPVWYVYRGGKFYIGTNTRTKKARNLRGNTRAAFCVDVGVNAPEINGVAGSGSARLILDGAEVRRIAGRILSRYYDSLDNEAAQELLNDTDCIIELTPEKFSRWSY
ncbi:conserved hypothetical protein [Cenarchaeum symbiosum A]|uniref:Pyridoxamine 5'-phosphate oxidase N-terminal domain-containing protein n=1 Tax=Cenarchaeum symbiosum (strain A) TaxID=414004 RepID=A0RZ13_CENSY|nr:conserved hypothetical protein [Cenarchaeum symbiosum A]